MAMIAAAGLAPMPAAAQDGTGDAAWRGAFDPASCSLRTLGRNPYFILVPGHRLVLESGDARLEITVLEDIEMVDGIETRVVEEREWQGGELYEVSRNYIAICEETQDVVYFGEWVDFYEDGEVVKHDGSWRAGTGANKPGLLLPGNPEVGTRFYQEVAPGVAMDRAEIVSVSEPCETPAGRFPNCLKVKEQPAHDLLARLSFWEIEYKIHAPGIGLVGDEDLRLTAIAPAAR
jgi:hypothetical protein